MSSDIRSGPSGRHIFAFGDSHSIMFYHIEKLTKFKLKEHWLGFNTTLPITMHRFGLEGLDIKSAPHTVGNGHQNYIPKDNDIIIYCYGYNDIQQSIWKQIDHNRDIKEILETLSTNYINKVIENEKRFNTKSIIYGILSPPWSDTWHGTETLGTREKKYEYTQTLNNLLEEKCKEHNIYFWKDIQIETNDSTNKSINKRYALDGGHLNPDLAPWFNTHFETAINKII